MSSESSSLWIVQPKPNAMAATRLFCFPYAGGNAYLFRRWPESLPPFVEVCAVQSPGRGNRLQERPYTNLKALAQGTAEALKPYIDKPFAFFGHSMGALVGFEVARLLRENNERLPEWLFISGTRAPQLEHMARKTCHLSEPEFIEELRRLKGTPPEILKSPELMQLLLPLLRADFAVTETYEYEEGPPLPCPFVVFGGVEDVEVSPERLEAWRVHTSGSFKLHMYPGDHFFFHTSQSQILEVISQELQALRPETR